MDILIVSDFRVKIYKNKVYVSDKILKILERYYNSFGKISIYTRGDYSEPTDLTMHDFTYGINEISIVKNVYSLYAPSNLKKLKRAVQKCDLVVGRMESFPAMVAYDYAKKHSKPYYAELMSDPWDGLWNHGLLGKIVAPYAFFKTKQIMWNADYALYVTSEFLQRRYPCKNPSISASNVFINSVDNKVLEARFKHIDNMKFNKLVLMTTGAVYVKYKGQQYVIEAIPKLNKIGIRVRYIIIGEGSQEYLKTVAKKCGVIDQIEFTGKIGLEEVFKYADLADIYVQPSLQEGLPRAVIEAISRACPSIGAKTAGIPELISPECVFKRKSSEAIFQTILRVNKKDKLKELAQINFEKSKEFLNDVLNQKRSEYYNVIKNHK